MHKSAYILPVIATGTAYYLFQNKDYWWLYILMLVISEAILYALIRRASKKPEYLSGYAVNVQHHEAWTERIITTETYTDREGRTQTRQSVRYVEHPEEWLMLLNTGEWQYISPSAYDSCRQVWRTQMQEIDPPHNNCVSGGGGQLYDWDGRYETAATCTYKGLYINYVTHSKSIFRHDRPLIWEQEKLGLIHYPKFRKNALDIDPVLTSPSVTDYTASSDDQRAIQLINAIYGQKKQIHVFILIFDGNQSIETALKQKAHWDGGNKNEFTVCLGILPDSDGKGPTVKWSKAFSWSDIPSLETATESWFIANPKLDIPAYAEWLRKNLNLWKRKEFKDFKYLGVKLPTGRTVLLYIVSALLSAAIIYISSIIR